MAIGNFLPPTHASSTFCSMVDTTAEYLREISLIKIILPCNETLTGCPPCTDCSVFSFSPPPCPKSSRSVTPKASAKNHRQRHSAAHKPAAAPLKKAAKNGHKTVAKVPEKSKPQNGKPVAGKGANGKAGDPAVARRSQGQPLSRPSGPAARAPGAPARSRQAAKDQGYLYLGRSQ